MSRRFTRLFLLIVLAVSSKVWAIGLGDIKLDSALNEPLRAEIVLLSATPDEIAGLSVSLASVETFARYGLDRPFYLQDIEFKIENGGVAGSVVHMRSRAPITEPFLTFLVEANWTSGRLLREYTVLLDPPTYAPPAAQQAPAVTAPRRTAPSDSGRIERQPAAAAPTPVAASPRSSSVPKPQPPADDVAYDTLEVGSIVVERGNTLWGVTARMRPDSRLSMNQTMLAIYQANPGAFGGNINLLKEGATLRIPSADEIFQISHGDALSEVRRQNSAWGLPDDGGRQAATPSQRPLILVPADDEPVATDIDDGSSTYEPLTREEEIDNRIRELEDGDVPDQYSLIEIRDNELASLRQELAEIRGEVYEPQLDDVSDNVVDNSVDDAQVDEIFVDEVFVDDGQSDDASPVDEQDTAAAVEDPAVADDTATGAPRDADESIIDRLLGFASSYLGMIAGAVVAVIALLFWFMRRGADDDDDARPWETLDADDDIGIGSLSATETMQAPSIEEAIVVVEQDSGVHPVLDDTLETPAAVPADDEATGSFGSLEDTFSSETAVNLDQTDPIAEADFHMAYGLYDQAADLINGALESDPSDKGLMSKLCEIYFVWGNRDAFVDAATRLKSSIGDAASSDWDKIVIMGQQIAADDGLFAGADVAGVSREVDLAFDEDGDDAGALDMDFGAEADSASEVIDLGDSAGESADDMDFVFDDVTAENQTIDMPLGGAEGGTSDLPSLDESLGQAISDSGLDSDATAEINLDELDFDIAGLAETEIASLDDLDDTGQMETLSDTGVNESVADPTEVTGRNPEIDPNATGVRQGLELDDLEDLESTSEMKLAGDDTGIDIDASLLDATGMTQVLGSDMAVDTATGFEEDLTDADATLLAPGLGKEVETLLAPLDDEGGSDFDFARTEALPADSYSGDHDDTAATPALAETDLDLDLDDLTAALKVSEVGDTIEQLRDAETVEQPRPALPNATAEVPTMELSPEDMRSDLQEARTMTEVGTKLDLARAYVDMGDPAGARSILDEVLDEGDAAQKQQAQKLLDSLPS